MWPDRAKTTLWLLERLDAAEAERDRLKAALIVWVTLWPVFLAISIFDVMTER